MRAHMRSYSRALITAVVLALVIVGWRTWSIATPLANIFYVNAATGSDTNDCLSPVVALSPVGPCLTINGAIGKASTGDTINVAAGTYNEQVLVNKTVTLNGAQQGVDARTRNGA